MAKVNIFISSTCYDLSQIRTDLKDFIVNLGHIPILSEDHDFPINPNLSNSENCINVVNNYADIFVLIIGSRYGYTLSSGKSITNTEFLTALKKGIPIYTFTKKEMINIYSIWEKNPQIDLSHIVDTNDIFNFIKDVRSKSGLWNFPFENAQDIKNILTSQLSILFNESLKLRGRINKLGKDILYPSLSSKSLNLILEKEDNYELKFYLQCYCDEIEKYSHLKNDHKYSILIKAARGIDNYSEYFNYINVKFGEMGNMLASFNTIMNEAYPVYYGEPGESSDLEGLYYIAKTMGKLYKSLIEWSMEVRGIIVPNEYKASLTALSNLPNLAISQIEHFPSTCLNKIIELESSELENTEPITMTLDLHIDETDNKMYLNELSNLMQLNSVDILGVEN